MKRRNLFAALIAWIAAVFFPRESRSVTVPSVATLGFERGPIGYHGKDSVWTPWDGLDAIVRKYNEMPAERFYNREKAKIVQCYYIAGNNHLEDDHIRIDIDRKIGEIAFVAVFYREPMPKHDAELRESIRAWKRDGGGT